MLRRIMVRKKGIAVLLAALCGVAVSMVWDPVSAAAMDDGWSCQFGSNGKCVGFPNVTCPGTGCDHCSSGCAGAGSLASAKCVQPGEAESCIPMHTACGTIFTENISPCTIVCMCDMGTVYTAACPGSWQSGCDLGGPPT